MGGRLFPTWNIILTEKCQEVKIQCDWQYFSLPHKPRRVDLEANFSSVLRIETG